MIYTGTTPRRYLASDLEILQQRTDQAQQPPYWPFPALTPQQAAAHADQAETLRRRAVRPATFPARVQP